MHDPDVVAFDIRRPWPKRSKVSMRRNPPRWQIGWRAFWFVAGREWYWPSMVTIWHREPNGRDALTVCRRRYRDRKGKWRDTKSWHWHIHHWRVQIHLVRKIHRFLFERCEQCGRRFPWGYAPVAHQWDQPRGKWFRVTKRAYHHECSSLVTYKRLHGYRGELIRLLVDEVLSRSHEDELTFLDRIAGSRSPLPFHLGHHLESTLDYERDDDYNLVKKES